MLSWKAASLRGRLLYLGARRVMTKSLIHHVQTASNPSPTASYTAQLAIASPAICRLWHFLVSTHMDRKSGIISACMCERLWLCRDCCRRAVRGEMPVMATGRNCGGPQSESASRPGLPAHHCWKPAQQQLLGQLPGQLLPQDLHQLHPWLPAELPPPDLS